MTTHRLINWLLALLICLGMATSYLLDNPSDHAAAVAHATSLDDAKDAAAREVRFAKAAAAVCGINAAAQDLGDGTVQCMTHKGRKTVRAAL